VHPEAREALSDIDAALAKIDASSEYWSTFKALRYDIQVALQSPNAIDDLRDAVATCENDRYKAILEKRLAAAEGR
jgi:hypothetical protein